MRREIAITGATGIIGRWVVNELINTGHKIKILTRKNLHSSMNIEVHRGDITQPETLKGFLTGIDSLIHCAGEIHNEENMFKINVEGTRNILELAEKEAPEIRIIHLSSAGVIGNPKKQNFVNENTKPQPNNTYEKSKYEAEIIALSSPLSSSTVLVRPINVVDRTKPGVAASYLQKSFKNLLKTILFGNEFAHMIHAKTVAQAILFLESHADKPSGIFFVSNDHDSMNRFRYIWSEGKKTFLPIFPLFISGIIRKITGGHNNTGRICYSSSRLKSLGFKDFCNVNETLKLLDSSLPAEKTLSVL